MAAASFSVAEALVDDDGRPRRTGTVWTATAHIITATIGSGVLSLPWAIAQLGWVASPAVMLFFAFVICYTSTLIADCYRTGDRRIGNGNYTYMDAVRANLEGGANVTFCGVIQYANLVGVAIGYTISASISMLAISRVGCFHHNGRADPCHRSGNTYMILFGAVQIVLSHIPDYFYRKLWLTIVSAFMFFTYAGIGVALSIAQIISNGGLQGSLTGVSSPHKVWRSLQAFGEIAFAYSFSSVLIEIQDTIKAPPPSEAKVMKLATRVSVATTTVLYMLSGCMGYAAFGDAAPENLLTGFGFYEPFWLLDIANVAVVVCLVRAYQVTCQPIFAGVESWASGRWPGCAFITGELRVGPFKVSLLRLTWRSAFVCVNTVVAILLLPLFGNVVVLLGAVSFWPLTVYFPVEMYIARRDDVQRGGAKWVSLKLLTAFCLVISVATAAGSFAGIIEALKVYRPFSE